MIYKIRGILKEIIPPNRVILERENLFWEIYIPFNLIEILKRDFFEKEIEFFVCVILRKNEYLEIYGFLSREERELFLKLNTLSKVGPKLGLNILSVYTPELLRKIIEEGKVRELAKIPGIGEKRAEKLFLDLKGLFGRIPIKGRTIPLEKERILQEAKISLVNLGFNRKEVEDVLFRVFHQDDSLESLIKKALRELAPTVKEERFE
ncbi:MAG: Holliday junction branch migration protein RuvA [Caldimicrobium sp.]|jgi:Holliday junction DNA helicase RuvA